MISAKLRVLLVAGLIMALHQAVNGGTFRRRDQCDSFQVGAGQDASGNYKCIFTIPDVADSQEYVLVEGDSIEVEHQDNGSPICVTCDACNRNTGSSCQKCKKNCS